ncbi:unnamed protein product [Rhizoctonia solani]|uniref:BTB domain-containing protein n=1 Tax=Rhizoctonia solani TaxID=456999 RepID=A0A8H3HT47_9AGAM|nr:unnamed protein product [Rhizoctonia solani]
MESPRSTTISSPSQVPEFACILTDSALSELNDDIITPTDSEATESAPPDCEGMPLFESGDGDMHISVNGTRFETHKYLIKRFQGLRQLLEDNPREISVQRNDISVEDFRETFRILYTSAVAAPFVFRPQTLVAALRVATVYEYYALRHYCIQYLETLDSKMDVAERILIARELHLPVWEEHAHRELETRDEPITEAEAAIIGLDAFVRIAGIREKEQRRRGKEVDTAGGAKDVLENTTSNCSHKASPPCSRPDPHDNTSGSTILRAIYCETESVQFK